jgi:hypothetical protein
LNEESRLATCVSSTPKQCHPLSNQGCLLRAWIWSAVADALVLLGSRCCVPGYAHSWSRLNCKLRRHRYARCTYTSYQLKEWNRCLQGRVCGESSLARQSLRRPRMSAGSADEPVLVRMLFLFSYSPCYTVQPGAVPVSEIELFQTSRLFHLCLLLNDPSI